MPCIATTYLSLAVPACAKAVVRAAFGRIRKDIMGGYDQPVSLYPDRARDGILRIIVQIWDGRP